jgi:hypothetical protein
VNLTRSKHGRSKRSKECINRNYEHRRAVNALQSRVYDGADPGDLRPENG